MEQVGYDTYCKLLDEVVKEMQGIKVTEEKDIQIDMNVSSFIPDEYIENSSQKIEIYQDIALSKNEEDLANVIDEIIDRYGNMPKEVENLIKIAKIKQLCKMVNILKIVQRRENAVFYFDVDNFNTENIDNLIKEYRNLIKFSPGKEPYVTLILNTTSEDKILESITQFLEKCLQNENSKVNKNANNI